MADDVLDLLTADHREMQALVDEALATDDTEQRRELLDRAISLMVRHAVAEETVVYPVMVERLENGQEAVDHDTKEHEELEVLMKRLEADASTETLQELKDVLEDHVHDEEDDQFPLIRRHVDDEHLHAMGVAVEALKKVAPTRPHPSAPNNALFHLMVGPGIGMVDRLRDKLAGRTSS